MVKDHIELQFFWKLKIQRYRCGWIEHGKTFPTVYGLSEMDHRNLRFYQIIALKNVTLFWNFRPKTEAIVGNIYLTVKWTIWLLDLTCFKIVELFRHNPYLCQN